MPIGHASMGHQKGQVSRAAQLSKAGTGHIFLKTDKAVPTPYYNSVNSPAVTRNPQALDVAAWGTGLPISSPAVKRGQEIKYLWLKKP